MATHRNRYVKVALFEEVKTHLQDAKVVGQGSDYLLLERPQPKAREKSATPRKPRTKKVVAAEVRYPGGTLPAVVNG
jgi:hypothetical protein